LKKLSAVLLTGLLLVLGVTGVQAVTWDVPAKYYPVPAGNYGIPYNGGTTWVSFNQTDNRIFPVLEDNPDLFTQNTPASNTNVEDWGNSNSPPLITFNAMAGGGVLADGVSTAGYLGIMHDGVTGDYGVSEGYQRIDSTIFRNFIPDGYGTITVTADLAGDIAWLVNNYDWVTNGPPEFGEFDPYSGYRLWGDVTIVAHDASLNDAIVGSIGSISLDNGSLSGSLQFDPVSNPNIFYVMGVALRIDTWIQNADPMWGTYYFPGQPMPEELRIGTASAPFELTTLVSQSQVPIPPTLVLLLSGVGGLVAIRRRVTGARGNSR